jgi:ATP-binding cassette subfamily B protein
VLIAHRSSTLRLADRVIVLDEGRIVAEGTHDQLLAENERYRQVLAQAAERDAA